MARSVDIFGITGIPSRLLGPQTVTTTINGPSVDVTDLAGQGVALIDVFNIGGTPTFDAIIQEADDTGFTLNVATIATFTQITAAEVQRQRVDLNGARQFVRIRIVVAGGTPSAEIASHLTPSRHRLPTG